MEAGGDGVATGAPAAAASGAPTSGTAPDEATRAAVRVQLLERAPEAVRAKVAELASVAVGHMPVTDLPPPVRAVSRFAPSKRARAGAGPLLTALGLSLIHI